MNELTKKIKVEDSKMDSVVKGQKGFGVEHIFQTTQNYLAILREIDNGKGVKINDKNMLEVTD